MGVGALLPTHVSNTKPSNCPHDPREEDQPGRNKLMDGDRGQNEGRKKRGGARGSEMSSLGVVGGGRSGLHVQMAPGHGGSTSSTD